MKVTCSFALFVLIRSKHHVLITVENAIGVLQRWFELIPHDMTLSHSTCFQDHHCVYLNNCVGHGNHSHFVWFLIFAVLGCSHAAFILMCSLYAGLYRDYFVYFQQYSRATVRLTTWSLIFTVFNIGLSIGVVIAVGMLLYFQLRSILKNRTGIEDWIIDKAVYRRKILMKSAKEAGDQQYEVEPFVYPYDLGNKRNLTQVLNLSCLPIGDGVSWPVVDGCDQYTLTVIDLSSGD